MLYRKDDGGRMNSRLDISLLYDFYGELLQPSQQRVTELCVNEDMSLSEVADLLGISRQGVRDSLSRAERKLCGYEEKLGLLRAYKERTAREDMIRSIIREIKATEGRGELLPQLDKIEELLKGDD